VKKVLLLLGVLGCAGGPRPVRVPDLAGSAFRPQRPVMKVGPRIITEGEVYRRVLRRFGTPEILWGIATEELLSLAAAERDIRISDEEVEKLARSKYEGWLKETAGDPLTEHLRSKGLFSESALLETFRAEAASELLLSKVVVSYRSLDETALQQYYRRTYAQERVRVRRIAFPVFPGQDEKNAKKHASEVCEQLRAGRPWAEVVRPYLEPEDGSPPKAVGGEWWIGDQEDHPQRLKEIVFSLKAGEVSDPVWEEGFGYHVFKVEERIPPEPFSACVEKMREEIRSLPPEPEEVQKVLADLEERYPLAFFPAEKESSE